MPFYDYKCPECGHVEELMLSISEHDKDTEHVKQKESFNRMICPICDKGSLRPMISTSSTFKINGFSYSNGYS